jgi:transposase InsO family protein
MPVLGVNDQFEFLQMKRMVRMSYLEASASSVTQGRSWLRAIRRAAMDEIVDWLGFYNSRRLHSTLDYVSPMTFEKNWFAAQQGRAA